MKTKLENFAGNLAPAAAASSTLDPRRQPGFPLLERRRLAMVEQRVLASPRARPRQSRQTIGWVTAIFVLACGLAAIVATRERPTTAVSYNHRMAELDAQLSKALTSQLRAAGFSVDSAVVSVEGPACQRAECLFKRLHRNDEMASSSDMSARHVGNGTWLFTGSGRLANIRFGVDAAAEMQRLVESTPPAFPQAVLTTWSPERPGGDRLSSFDQVFDIWMPARSNEPQAQWLDLEKARCLVEPDPDYFVNPPAQAQWLHSSGADLYAVVYPDRTCWICTHCLLLVRAENKSWEQAKPEEIIAHPALQGAPQRVRCMVPAGRNEKETYLFRTDGGTFGILRLTEINYSTQQIRIQYKVAPRPAVTAR